MLLLKKFPDADSAGAFNKIEVFKTNVLEASEAQKLVALLQQHFPGTKINFDLQDCDNILRVEGGNFVVEKIISLLIEHRYDCSVLE